jgi:hypothetical protein
MEWKDAGAAAVNETDAPDGSLLEAEAIQVQLTNLK